MCGIIGYAGNKDAVPYLVNGLERLEYRGYDSAGIAVLDEDKINCLKCTGKLKNLKTELKKYTLEGNTGIGHTRWATHGTPDHKNSHPHLSNDGKFAVVHNGIIENYIQLKDFLTNKGYSFKSQTDTEVIPNLISYYYRGDFFEAVLKATDKLLGSYALCILHCESRDIIATKKDSPLVIGTKDGENLIASDMYAIAEYTKNIYLLKDREYALINSHNVSVYSQSKEEINIKFEKIDFDVTRSDKKGYKHFMLKEIYEQPQAIKNSLSGRVSMEYPVKFDRLDADFAKSIEKIIIVACGTAYNAALIGKTAIETLAKIPVETDIASEFRYRSPLISKNSLVIAISQSGETADTLQALRLAKEEKAKVLAITNVEGSSIAREADYTYYTRAGIEIAVASTKGYTTQLSAMYNLALFLAQTKNTLTLSQIDTYKKELINMSSKVETYLKNPQQIQEISKRLSGANHIVFIGRGVDFASVTEGDLKLKEISYIYSHAYPAGELKHGPIALIDNNTPVICLCTQNDLFLKFESNVKEVMSRGAYTIGILEETMHSENFKGTLFIPKCNPLFAPIISAIPLQLIAYYTALFKGLDPDKPRNLAKSVTVE